MIETIVIDYLTRRGLAVSVEEPRDEIAPPYYVIEKTAGSETEHLRRATVAVKSYGSTLYEAAAADKVLTAVLPGIVELDSVTRCELTNDYNFTDMATKRYRYQAVFEITYYEEG